MARTGSTNRLMIVRDADQGFYLDAGDPEQDEILLPKRYVPEDLEQGDEIEVFIYRDSEDRLVATTEKPLREVGQFGAFEVVAVNKQIGAFLDWGLLKDLLLPFREQAVRVSKGDRIVARVVLDDRSDRIIATTKFDRYLDKRRPQYDEGQAVRLLVFERTPLGYNAIVNDAHRGLLYHSDLTEPPEIGVSLDGYVRAVRPGGGIDLSLRPSGYGRIASLEEQVLDALEQGGGRLELGDKSPPEEIQRVFGTSKKAFKQALGGLYKKRLIRFVGDGVESVTDSSLPTDERGLE